MCNSFLDIKEMIVFKLLTVFITVISIIVLIVLFYNKPFLFLGHKIGKQKFAEVVTDNGRMGIYYKVCERCNKQKKCPIDVTDFIYIKEYKTVKHLE